MRKQIFSMFILTAFFLHFTQSASAQNPVNDWSNLRKVSLGKHLIIEPKTGAAIKASLERVGDSEIVVYSRKNFVTFKKDSIARIYLSRTGSEKIAADNGLTAGFFIGVAAGIFLPAAIPLMLAGSGSGYLIGKESAKKKKRGLLIYEAQ
jgi:hypothetical protein